MALTGYSWKCSSALQGLISDVYRARLKEKSLEKAICEMMG
jgi:hypothetical protein